MQPIYLNHLSAAVSLTAIVGVLFVESKSAEKERDALGLDDPKAARLNEKIRLCVEGLSYSNNPTQFRDWVMGLVSYAQKTFRDGTLPTDASQRDKYVVSLLSAIGQMGLHQLLLECTIPSAWEPRTEPRTIEADLASLLRLITPLASKPPAQTNAAADAA